MLVQDKIVTFLKATGPTLPAKVAKNIGTEIFIASAHLSDLASQGKVKISHLKVGASPLYYLPGQEDQLFRFASGNVNPKDLTALERLKGSLVLREADMDLLSKVAFRSLKDFAIPLNVNYQGKSELFWRWHLISPERTNQIIGNILRGVATEVTKEPEVAPEPVVEEQPEVAAEPVAAEEPQAVPVEPEKPVEETTPVEEPEPEVKETEEPEQVKEPEPAQADEPVQEPEPETKQEVEEPPVKVEKPKKVSKKEKQKKLSEDVTKTKKPRRKVKDDFLPFVQEFLQGLDISHEEHEIVRKNSEVNLLATVPSVVGSMKYFCKAKSKTKCDEKDISAAYMEAQIKKLPLLFLHKGNLTKKARDMLETGAFENAVMKKIN